MLMDRGMKIAPALRSVVFSDNELYNNLCEVVLNVFQNHLNSPAEVLLAEERPAHGFRTDGSKFWAADRSWTISTSHPYRIFFFKS